MMEIAQYKRMGDYNYETVQEVSEYYEDGTDWVRISTIVDVEFTPLPAEVTVPKEIACFEVEKEEVRVKYLRVVGAIDDKISKLLAIENQNVS